MATVQLRFTALPAHVRTARMLAVSLARRLGVDDGALDEVRLCVGEACARAVGLHLVHAPDQPVEVDICDDNASFVVVVRDRAPAGTDVPPAEIVRAADLFDRQELGEAESDPDDEPATAAVSGLLPDGFELALVAGIVDELLVEPRDDAAGSVVTMTWRERIARTA